MGFSSKVLNSLTETELRDYQKSLSEFLAKHGLSAQWRTWGFGKNKKRELGIYPIKGKR
jgi:hypothetical protein